MSNGKDREKKRIIIHGRPINPKTGFPEGVEETEGEDLPRLPIPEHSKGKKRPVQRMVVPDDADEEKMKKDYEWHGRPMGGAVDD